MKKSYRVFTLFLLFGAGVQAGRWAYYHFNPTQPPVEGSIVANPGLDVTVDTVPMMQLIGGTDPSGYSQTITMDNAGALLVEADVRRLLWPLWLLAGAVALHVLVRDVWPLLQVWRLLRAIKQRQREEKKTAN